MTDASKVLNDWNDDLVGKEPYQRIFDDSKVTVSRIVVAAEGVSGQLSSLNGFAGLMSRGTNVNQTELTAAADHVLNEADILLGSVTN